MDLALKASEVDAIARAMKVLLSPLEWPDEEQWLLVAVDAVKEALGVDAGFVTKTSSAGSIVYSRDYQPPTLESYLERTDFLEQTLSFSRRQIAQRVYTRETLLGKTIDVYYRSDYYADLIVPNRAISMTGMSARLSPAPDESLVNMQFNRSRSDRPFGPREQGILQLLLPSFEQGATIAHRTERFRAELLGFVNNIDVAMAFIDRNGRLMHLTPALEAILQQNPSSATLFDAIKSVARALLLPSRELLCLKPRSTCQSMTVGPERLRLRGTRIGEPILGSRSEVACVIVEPLQPSLPTEEEICLRFDLTRREACVALLIARRMSSSEIAAALSISPHTVRRHTERVLMKLGVHSRRKVPDVLSAATEECSLTAVRR
jgi:hypothetical protein